MDITNVMPLNKFHCCEGKMLMNFKDDVRMLIEIAQMYYEQRATQEEISKQFHISRSLVSKYLSKARQIGIVEIIIHDELHPYKKLEEQIIKKYNLKDVICVNGYNEAQIKSSIGEAGAKFLSRILTPNLTIGISAGTTVHAVANEIKLPLHVSPLTFVPLVGGLGREHGDIQANVVCDIMARKTGGISETFFAPVTVDSVHAKEVFLSQKFIKESMEKMKNVDIALVGIGGRPTYFEVTNAYLHKLDPIEPKEASYVVGDFCYNFIDEKGQAVDSEWNERVMAINLDDVKKIPLVIAVAGGSHKSEGIKAALNGGLIDVLITDSITANKILKESK